MWRLTAKGDELRAASVAASANVPVSADFWIGVESDLLAQGDLLPNCFVPVFPADFGVLKKYRLRRQTSSLSPRAVIWKTVKSRWWLCARSTHSRNLRLRILISRRRKHGRRFDKAVAKDSICCPPRHGLRIIAKRWWSTFGKSSACHSRISRLTPEPFDRAGDYSLHTWSISRRHSRDSSCGWDCLPQYRLTNRSPPAI